MVSSDLELAPLREEDFGAWRHGVIDRLAQQRKASATHEPGSAHETATHIVDRRFPEGLMSRDQHVFAVRAGHREIGTCWLAVTPEHREAFVYDIATDDAHAAAAILEALETTAARLGAGTLRVNAFAHDAVLCSALRQRNFQVSATQMRLVLPAAPGGAGGTDVELRPMDHNELAHYRSAIIARHADDLLRSRMVPASEATRRSDEEVSRLLPDGPATENVHLWRALVAGAPVGTLWVETEGDVAFIGDISVDPPLRRRGYGRKIMRALETFCREHGITGIRLSVFGFNVAARAMYDQLGYEPVEQVLYKGLPTLT